MSTPLEPVATGKFEPTWESLKQYRTPEWFRDAKFGIWAHWGPQCQPEAGDWYARRMYQEGTDHYRSHLEKYGHPSESGFKEVIHEWRAEKWDPDRLVALYKRVGAQYFFAMANHHDNLDLWDSKHQPWSSVKVGPGKDIVGGWAKAAKAHGLPLGLSVHAAHAWLWYEPAQGADQSGDKAGVPYDGRLTRSDGTGKWWEGLDPQDLYAQNHEPTPGYLDPQRIFTQWEWENGASVPDEAYCQRFCDRTLDMINQHQPDLIYFDDTVLPFWPLNDVGLKIAAHLYNRNMEVHGGRLEAVLFGKILDDEQRKALVWDIERGVPATAFPFAWQTDTCLGDWHYDRSVYERGAYKSAKTVIQMLADIVSKNGNLLLNVPVRGDGSIDDKEEAILEEIGRWMAVNGEAIYGTRPWEVFGEGPASAGAELSAQGFNEGKGKPFTAADVRFTTKGNVLYAILLDGPGETCIESLGQDAAHLEARSISRITLLGHEGDLEWSQTGSGLRVDAPGEGVRVLKIEGAL